MTYTIDETAEITGVSRATAYRLIKDGTFPSIKIGKRLLVPRKALYQFINGSVCSCQTDSTEEQP
jgi:excisionase family DNA binding protein